MRTTFRFAPIAALLSLHCGFLFETANAASPAEDPGRFTLVTNWYATFTRSLIGNGNGNYKSGDYNCSATWQYSQSQTVAGQFGPPEFMGFNQWIFYWYKTDSTTLDVTDSYKDTCTNPRGLVYHDSLTARSGQFLLPLDNTVNLTIDTKNKNYVLFFGISMVTTNDWVLLDQPQPNDSSSVTWSIPEAVTNSLPDTGLVLQGQQTFSLGTGVGWEMTPISKMFCVGCDRLNFSELNGNVMVTWSLSPAVEDLELIVEPIAYDKWIPQGNLPTPRQRGNSIRVSARLQNKGGGTPVARADSFEFTLSNVSNEPGVCMNYPPPDKASDQPDLQFEDELNPAKPGTGNSVGQSQVQIFKLDNGIYQGLLDADATISSFDYGAYGELSVTANVPGHDPIKGHLQGKTSTTIPIPKANSGSHIAIAWLDTQKANVSDDTDRDPFPEGDGDQGDGLSIYEEYRGFSINHTHVRTDPVKKDLFVRNELQSKEVQSEIQKFQSASHLEVHSKIDKDELGPDALINFNHGWAHNVDQHGVLLVGGETITGVSKAINRPGLSGNSTPGTKSQIRIDPAGPGYGLDLSTGHSGDALSYSQFFTASVAHELGHCCSVWHHGDCDLKTNILAWLEQADGSHTEVRNFLGVFSEIPITIFRPDRTALMDFQFGVDTNQFPVPFMRPGWLAVPQGQHSGDTSCIMCYNVAGCFRRDTSSSRYLNFYWPSTTQDHFCTSRDGMGVNAADTPGGSWLGNAEADGERGNCAGQICVNDLYAKGSKHDRNYNCPAW